MEPREKEEAGKSSIDANEQRRIGIASLELIRRVQHEIISSMNETGANQPPEESTALCLRARNEQVWRAGAAGGRFISSC